MNNTVYIPVCPAQTIIDGKSAYIKDEVVLRFRKLITIGCNGQSGKNPHVGTR